MNPNANCVACPYRVSLEREVRDLKEVMLEKFSSLVVSIDKMNDTQVKRHGLCAERGTEITNLKEQVMERKKEDADIWKVVTRIEKRINLGIGALLAGSVILQIIFQLWNKHQCLPIPK